MIERAKTRLGLLTRGQVILLAVFVSGGLIINWLASQETVHLFYANEERIFENEAKELRQATERHFSSTLNILQDIDVYIKSSSNVTASEFETFVSLLKEENHVQNVERTYFIPFLSTSTASSVIPHDIARYPEPISILNNGEPKQTIEQLLQDPEYSASVENAVRNDTRQTIVDRYGEDVLMHVITPVVHNGIPFGLIGSEVSVTDFALENYDREPYSYEIAFQDGTKDIEIAIAKTKEHNWLALNTLFMLGIEPWEMNSQFEVVDVTWRVKFVADPTTDMPLLIQFIPFFFFLGGTIVVLLMGSIIVLLITNESRAKEKAEELTRELESHQQKLLFHSSILHAINEGVVAVNKDGGIIYWDKRAEQHFGYGSEEAKGMDVLSLVPEDTKIKQNAKRIFSEINSGGTWSGEFPARKKNGSEFQVYITASPLYTTNGEVTGFVMTFRDITYRHSIEEERSKLTRIINESPDFISIISPEGNIEYLNKGGYAMVGSPDKGLYETTIFDLLPEWSGEMMRSIGFEEANKDGSWQGELDFIGKNGRKFPASITLVAHYKQENEIARYSITARDISDRKEIEGRLRNQTEQLAHDKARDEAILQSLGEGLIVTDKDGSVTFVNQAFVSITGHEEYEVIDKKVSEVIPMRTEDGEEVPFENQILTRVLSGEEKIIADEIYFFERKDGTQFPVSITASPITLGDGAVVGAVEVFHDITKEREIDQAKTEFVSLASHQLRTPLSTINWYSEMLLTGDAGKITKKQKEFLEQVHSSSTRMVDLVNALLNVSRIELGKLAVNPEPTDLRNLAEEVIGLLRERIREKDLEFRKEFADDIQTVEVDRNLISMVFQNLLSNALKYTPEGQAFGMVMHHVSAGEVIEGVTVEKDGILTVVWDHGYGIPKEQQEKVFSKMFRADNVKEKDTTGTGLGLYIVKAVIEGAGGQIWFKSAKDRGTTFFFVIPFEGMEEKDGSKGVILSNK